MSKFFVMAFFSILIAASAYFQWWRCGEMFPNAQLACFLVSK